MTYSTFVYGTINNTRNTYLSKFSSHQLELNNTPASAKSSPIMETIKKAIGSAFDPNTDIPDLSGKVRLMIALHMLEC